MAEDRRALVVGFGSAGRRHAENLLALGVSDVAVCSTHRRLGDVRVDDRVLPVFHDFETALASRPDAVVIANPTALHAAYASRAIDRGCHVYVEKPLGVSVRDVRDVVDQADRRRVTVAVGCQFRFNPCLERLKGLVEEGRLGRLLHVDVNMGEYLPDYHPDEDYRTSYAARRSLGGGVLLTQIHDLNYLRWLFGPFHTVYATGGKMSRLDVDVEDSVTMLLRAASGLGVAVHMDYVQRPRRRRLVVVGEDGTASWDYYANSLRVSAPDGTETEIGPGRPLDRGQIFIDTMADFLACAERGTDARTTAAEAMEDLRLVDAIRAALARDASVALTDEAAGL